MKSKPTKHIFVCTNLRAGESKSCGNKGLKIRTQLVRLLSNTPQKDHIRVNKSGCLGKCSLGPCMVIYPETQWHYSLDLNDIENIMSDLIKK